MHRHSLAHRVRALLYRNTELRLQVVQMEAEIKAQQAETQKWIDLTNDYHREAINWQQTAMMAIAKAERMERSN